MPRDMGPISFTDLENPLQEFWNFIRIDLPDQVLRFTDRPFDLSENIDGSVQTWLSSIFEYGNISQSIHTILTVNWVVFADLDSVFKNLVYNPGLRNRTISFFVGRWNAETGAFINAYPIYEGRIDEADGEDEINFSIKPHFTPWEAKVPYAKMGGRCVNDFMNPLDCQFPYTPGLICAKTREACREYDNEININIYDRLPAPNETLLYGGVNHGVKELN